MRSLKRPQISRWREVKKIKRTSRGSLTIRTWCWSEIEIGNKINCEINLNDPHHLSPCQSRLRAPRFFWSSWWSLFRSLSFQSSSCPTTAGVSSTQPSLHRSVSWFLRWLGAARSWELCGYPDTSWSKHSQGSPFQISEFELPSCECLGPRGVTLLNP